MTIKPARFACSRGQLLALVVLALGLLSLIFVASASAATKYFDSSFGASSAAAAAGFPAGTAYGGSFSTSNGGVGDIAVNDPSITTDGTGQSGWIYVVDRGNNRIQAFDQNKNFQWAIGRDVIASTVNEHQNLTVTPSAASTNFKLEFNGQTTGDLAWNASTGTVQTALRGLSTITGTNVAVTGTVATATTPGTYVISFVGTLAAADQPQVTVQPGTTPLTGTASVNTVVNGTNSVPGNLGDVFEKCTVAVHCKAGSIGTAADGPGGELAVATGIDINQATGDLLVGERANNRRVQQFEADGDFVRAFGWDVVQSGSGNTGGFETCNAADGDICQASTAAGNAAGQFGNSTVNISGVAVAPPGAPNAGKVYVADPGTTADNRRVLSFVVPATPTGAVVPGASFAATGGCTSPNAGKPDHLAADANGVVYASNVDGVTGAIIIRYDTTTDSLLNPIGACGINTVLGSGAISALEVDTATDHLLVGRSGLLGIMELDVSDKPEIVDTTDLVDSHVVGLAGSSAVSNASIGVNPVADLYYVPTQVNATGTGIGHRVLVLDEDGVDPDSEVSIDPATNVGATTATFNGFIDPVLTSASGFQTSYRWQISKDGVTWTDVAPDALVGGNGFTPQDVSVNATGLESNTLYLVRIRTTRSPAAGLAFSPELVFKTDPAPPSVETLPARQVSDIGAQLVGRLNPGGLTTEYWFEWGDNNYGNTLPIDPASASGSLMRVVGERLGDLTPERFYHFRLCARNSLSAEKVCGTDRSFTTLAGAGDPAGARSYEMVLSPLKPLRRGGERGRAGFDYTRLEAGSPAAGGGAFRSHLFAGATDAEAGHGFTRGYSHEVRGRAPGGLWTGNAVFNVPLEATGANATAVLTGESANLDTMAWQLIPSIFASESGASVRVMGDNGGPRGGGWYPWLDPAWLDGGPQPNSAWTANISDDGERLVAHAADGVGSTSIHLWRDMTPSDDSVSPDELTPPQTSGHTVFLSDRDHDWRPTDLVNECTGAGAASTLVPSRDDNGTPSGPAGSFTAAASTYNTGETLISVSALFGGTVADIRVGHYVSGPGIPPNARVVSVDTTNSQFVISAPTTATQSFPGVTLTGGQDVAALADDTVAARPCQQGSPTDVRGAILGSRGADRLGETAAGAMSESGDRVFFLSPDPAIGEGQTACSPLDGAVGAATRCPAQLFVRQFDDAGNPTVRWISRPEDALFGAGQQSPSAALGTGVAFEGASHDGSVVYFRTDAALTTDDPNGGLDPLEESSPKSWDLYRYELGPDNNADPGAGDPGDRLTRLSGGPAGNGDPNTNCARVDTGSCVTGVGSGQGPNGGGQVLRFVSDGGDRAYFVTTSQIPGADNSAPADSGATNVPTASNAQVNDSARNIYLYDANKSGAAAYKFVARVPFSTAATTLDGCASAHGAAGAAPRLINMEHFTPQSVSAQIVARPVNCVHGSSSGDVVVFETPAQLTVDDTDTNSDVYAYDAAADKLVRLSAPPADGVAYPCVQPIHRFPATVSCNGDLGFPLEDDAPQSREPGLFGSRRWNVSQDAQGNLTDVYFETRLPLVEDDANAADASGNGGMDVYRWSRVDGRLTLVSPGDSDDDSAFYAGNSVDGTDVFFWTEQRLSPWEIDEADGDVYNATTRTDLRPDPVPPPPTCSVLTGACQLGGGERIATPVATTEGLGDPGAEPVRTAEMTLRGISSQARRRAVRTGVLAVPLRLSVAGVVRVQATAELGGKSTVVARGSHRFRKSGSATVRMRLNAAARRLLGKGRPLALDVTARPSVGHAKSLSLTLRRATPRRGGQR